MNYSQDNSIYMIRIYRFEYLLSFHREIWLYLLLSRTGIYELFLDVLWDLLLPLLALFFLHCHFVLLE